MGANNGLGLGFLVMTIQQKLEMFAYSKTYGKGCLSHPTVEEHIKIAEELYHFIKAKNLIQLN